MSTSHNTGSLEAARERLEASLLKLSDRLRIREESSAEKMSQQSERIATLEQALYRIEAEKNKLIKNLEDQAHQNSVIGRQKMLEDHSDTLSKDQDNQAIAYHPSAHLHEETISGLQEKLDRANVRIKELKKSNEHLSKQRDDLQVKVNTSTLSKHYLSSDSAPGDFDRHIKKLEAERNDIRKVLDASIITIDAVINRKDA